MDFHPFLILPVDGYARICAWLQCVKSMSKTPFNSHHMQRKWWTELAGKLSWCFLRNSEIAEDFLLNRINKQRCSYFQKEKREKKKKRRKGNWNHIKGFLHSRIKTFDSNSKFSPLKILYNKCTHIKEWKAIILKQKIYIFLSEMTRKSTLIFPGWLIFLCFGFCILQPFFLLA